MVNEELLLYMTAFIAIVAIITILIMGIVVIMTMQKGIKKVYDLFAFLHKESEERIGRANVMVTQCTIAIENAAVASTKCADAAEQCARASQNMIDLTRHMDERYSTYVDKLREEKKQLEEQLSKADVKVVPQYVTHNHVTEQVTA